jgi:hypothetical protein
VTAKQISALIALAFALLGAYKALERVRREFERQPSLEA